AAFCRLIRHGAAISRATGDHGGPGFGGHSTTSLRTLRVAKEGSNITTNLRFAKEPCRELMHAFAAALLVMTFRRRELIEAISTPTQNVGNDFRSRFPKQI